MSNGAIWSFVYEPKKFNDMILEPTVKAKLRKAFTDVPNLLLYGKPGVGKGTFVHILLKETKYDYLWINASDETGIDTMRDKVRSFATAMGMTKYKIVVLNEADSLSAGHQGSQKMLRQLMEDVQEITRFILLANYEHNIIPEIKSRCQVIEINNPPGRDIFALCEKILKAEGVKYDKKVVTSIIKKCYPDIRKTIWSLQENTIDKILGSDMVSSSEAIWKTIFDAVISKDLEKLRSTLRSYTIDYEGLYSYLFDNVGEFKSPGDAIIEIGEHLYRNSFVAIKEINFMHMVVSMMKNGVI